MEINKKLAKTNTEIYELLKKIELNLYPCHGDNNWGHVGSTVHIKELLKEITEFMGVE